ncbi:MAG TPA: tripartite tricarboxylate transporter substrate-binding protein [Pseudolabrys sp.]|nr:tripartite tricarboxylate transporter substrate-binding protein [Pseudolabrys sp.]
MRKILLPGMLALFMIPAMAAAQEWPAKQPIHVIISNTPGSALDVTARLVFDQVGRQIGQTIVAENRAGAANTIGIAAVAKAEPDGYTVLVTTSGIAIAPYTHKSLPYDTTRDLRAVSPLGNLTNVLITPAGRFKSLKDLVAAAKVKPDALLYASIGPGSTGHLTAERLGLSAGFKALHVPFKGTAEGVADLAAGRVDFFFTPITAALGLIREHKVEALAIGSSTRSSLMPDLPTTVEAGYPDSDYNFWIGVFVPAATPEPIVTRLHDEIKKALQVPDVKDKIAKFGAEPMDMTLAQFEAYFKKELVINQALVKAANIQPQ